MSKANVAKRSVSPLIVILRSFLMGRKHNSPQRFSVDVATRSPPPPNLPDGPSHQLATNYYFQRDARREVAPPNVLVGKQLQIPAKEYSETFKKPPTPGISHAWD